MQEYATFDTQNIDLPKQLDPLLDVTYDYVIGNDWFATNLSLFKNYANILSIGSYNDVYTTVMRCIDTDKKHITKLLDHVIASSDTYVLRSHLQYCFDVLDMVSYWLPFEIEKAWIPLHISDASYQKHIDTIGLIETKYFWWRVCDNQQEMYLSLQFLDKLAIIWWSSRDHNDRIFFQNILDRMHAVYTAQYWNSHDEILEISYQAKYKVELQPSLQRELSAQQVAQIFSLAFAIYWIDKRVVVSTSHASVYDWSDCLYVPNVSKSVFSVLKLLQHEIDAHYVIWKNHEQQFRGIKWAWRVIKDEWVAILFEKMFVGEKISTVEVTSSMPQILLWELLAWDDFVRMIQLFLRANDRKTDLTQRILRLKRNYPINWLWTQRKDTSYTRWTHQLIKMIHSWINPKSFLSHKIWFNDMQYITTQDETTITKPFLLWEMFYFMLFVPDFSEESFASYIQTKYNFLPPDMFSFAMTNHQKDLAGEIMKIFKDS